MNKTYHFIFNYTLDVIFFEDKPFYPKSDIQGESSITREYQFWALVLSTLPSQSIVPSRFDTSSLQPESINLT